MMTSLTENPLHIETFHKKAEAYRRREPTEILHNSPAAGCRGKDSLQEQVTGLNGRAPFTLPEWRRGKKRETGVNWPFPFTV